MAHSCAATSSSISIVNHGFCFSSGTRSRAQSHGLSLHPDTLQYRSLRLKGTEKKLRFNSVKAVYGNEDRSYRQGIWSIRDDLAIPSAPFMAMPEVRAARGPPPMVLEGMRNLTSQLFQHRIIRCGGEVNDEMAALLVSQLFHLDAIDPKKDIILYVNSPGGSVSAGMAIFDTMKHIRPDVATVCVGLAASMGAFLLSGGTKGKRYSLPSARIMIHQPLGGAQGRETEIAAQVDSMLKLKHSLNGHLARNTGKPLRQIYEDTERDNFMSAKEAKEYGLIDEVITNPMEVLPLKS